MSESELRSLFVRFCDDGPNRYRLGEPFVQGGRMFATDGRVAVSVLMDEPDTKSDTRFPSMAAVMDYVSPATEQWNAVIGNCDKCGGDGSVMDVTCELCKGSGECTVCSGSGTELCCFCSHEHDCEDFDGGGLCEHCNGIGRVESYKTKCESCSDKLVDVGGVMLKTEIARKISLLGNVRYGIVKRSEKFSMIVFDADGGIRGIAAGAT